MNNSNPLIYSIKSGSSSNWKKNLCNSNIESVLNICSNSELWDNLSPFKSFLFFKSLLSFDKNLECLSALLKNSKPLINFIQNIKEDGFAIEDLKKIMGNLLILNKINEINLIINNLNYCNKKNIYHWVRNPYVFNLNLITKNKDFILNIKNNSPYLYSSILSKHNYIMEKYLEAENIEKKITSLEAKEYVDEYWDEIQILSTIYKKDTEYKNNLFKSILTVTLNTRGSVERNNFREYKTCRMLNLTFLLNNLSTIKNNDFIIKDLCDNIYKVKNNSITNEELKSAYKEIFEKAETFYLKKKLKQELKFIYEEKKEKDKRIM